MNNKINSYFGIDFGTTSSATVGYTIINQVPECFRYGDSEGRPIPSVVAIDKANGKVYTGREAWNKKNELSESCEYISSVKTMLDSDFQKEIGGKIWTPVTIAAELFKTLKNTVSERLGVEMESATVAIPVGFSPQKRNRIRQAAKLANINIDSFISEPTAAFFANYDELRSASNVVIFDWGGGTLDISVLKNEKGKISELAAAGNDVAGDNIDKKIATRIHNRIARKKGKEIKFEDMPSNAQDMMRVRAERAKRALGDDDTATISINNYGMYGVCRETLDYDWFVDIIEPEVNMAIHCLEDTIHQSGVGFANIDRIVLVGGSSNLRPLLEKLDKKYGDKLFFPEETMWNVGQGAAELAVKSGDFISNQSVGILMSDGSKFELLSPNTVLNGWSRNCRFGIIDTSKQARFVFCGSPDIDESSDKYKVLEIPTYNFLQEQIEVKAFVDADMVLQVIAGSTMRTKDYQRIWEYSRLKCCYKLPER